MNSPELITFGLAGLALGPTLGLVAARAKRVRQFTDGLSLVLVACGCLLVLLPYAVLNMGSVAFILAAVGAGAPMLLERGPGKTPRTLTAPALILVLYLMLDAATLTTHDEAQWLGSTLFLHRLPVGFAVVVAAQATKRPVGTAWAMLAVMVAASLFGVSFGPLLLMGIPASVAPGVTALACGVLLHATFRSPGRGAISGRDDDHSCGAHDDHSGHVHAGHSHASHSHDHAGHSHALDDDHAHDPAHAGHSHASHSSVHPDHAHGHAASGHPWAAAGFALGVGAVSSVGLLGPNVVDETVSSFLQTFGVLVLESAPALLLGYALAGIVPFLLTAARTAALGEGGRLTQSLRGVAFGLPLPVCSCGVLPLYESLIRKGAPPVAAMAFFVATPELGLDAVLLSVPLLGTSLTVARVVAAFVVAVLVSLLVGWRATSNFAPAVEAEGADSEQPLRVRIRAGLRFGFVEVFDHTMPWIVLGLLIAAAAEPLLSHGAIDRVPTVLHVPLAALIGVPIYVCASGATPIAALAIHKGLSTGAAMAFLIAGPATNVTTFGVLARLHGRKMAVLFGVTVTGLAVVAGWVVDTLGVQATPVLEAHAHAASHGTAWSVVSVLALSLLVMASLVRQGPRGAMRQIVDPIHTH